MKLTIIVNTKTIKYQLLLENPPHILVYKDIGKQDTFWEDLQ